MKPKFILCLVLVLSGGLFGCSTTKQLSNLSIRYHNAKYDFTFYLPESWKGYSVLTQQWDGEDYSPDLDKTIIVGHGLEIIIRSPQWKANKPYQDIPIVIFTRSQWNALRRGRLWPSIYAGGVMDELWHNHKYVFAISSRYNAADDENYSQAAAHIIAMNCAAHPEPLLFHQTRRSF